MLDPGVRKNPANIANDTGTNRVLVGERFVYFGGEGPTDQVTVTDLPLGSVTWVSWSDPLNV